MGEIQVPSNIRRDVKKIMQVDAIHDEFKQNNPRDALKIITQVDLTSTMLEQLTEVKSTQKFPIEEIEEKFFNDSDLENLNLDPKHFAKVIEAPDYEDDGEDVIMDDHE